MQGQGFKSSHGFQFLMYNLNLIWSFFDHTSTKRGKDFHNWYLANTVAALEAPYDFSKIPRLDADDLTSVADFIQNKGGRPFDRCAYFPEELEVFKWKAKSSAQRYLAKEEEIYKEFEEARREYFATSKRLGDLKIFKSLVEGGAANTLMVHLDRSIGVYEFRARELNLWFNELTQIVTDESKMDQEIRRRVDYQNQHIHLIDSGVHDPTLGAKHCRERFTVLYRYFDTH